MDVLFVNVIYFCSSYFNLHYVLLFRVLFGRLVSKEIWFIVYVSMFVLTVFYRVRSNLFNLFAKNCNTGYCLELLSNFGINNRIYIAPFHPLDRGLRCCSQILKTICWLCPRGELFLRRISNQFSFGRRISRWCRFYVFLDNFHTNAGHQTGSGTPYFVCLQIVVMAYFDLNPP